MHQTWRPDDVAAKCGAYRLMTQTNSEHRHHTGQLLHQGHRDACFVWGTGSGGDHDPGEVW